MTPLADILAADAKLAEEARKRAEKATPGPWFPRISQTPTPKMYVRAGSEGGTGVAYVQRITGRELANAEFIAAARTDIPALCAKLTAYREAVEIAMAGLTTATGSPEDAPWVNRVLAEIAAKLGGKP